VSKVTCRAEASRPRALAWLRAALAGALPGVLGTWLLEGDSGGLPGDVGRRRLGSRTCLITTATQSSNNSGVMTTKELCRRPRQLLPLNI
jgi:hypothetical protein